MWFLRWARDGVKNRMWGQLGWFSGLMCVGSVAGAVTWGVYLQNNTFNYEGYVPGINVRQQYALSASTNRWYAAFLISYPVEFLCLIVAKLMVLGRLTNNATRRCVTCV